MDGAAIDADDLLLLSVRLLAQVEMLLELDLLLVLLNVLLLLISRLGLKESLVLV